MEETRKEVKEPSIGKEGSSGPGKKEKGKGLLSSVKTLFGKGSSEKKGEPEKTEKKDQNGQTKLDSGTKKALIAIGGLLTVMASYVAYNHLTSSSVSRSFKPVRSAVNTAVNRGAPVNRTVHTARSKKTVKTVKKTVPASQTVRTVNSSAPIVKRGKAKKGNTKEVKTTQAQAVVKSSEVVKGAETSVAGKQKKSREKGEKGWNLTEGSAGKAGKTASAQTTKPGTGFFVNPEKTKFPNFKAFQEFYIKRLIELINEKRKELEEIQKEKQKIATEIAQLQLQVQRIAVIPKQVEKSSEKEQKKKEKKTEPVLVPITVYGVVCHGACKAYTDKGILTPGSVLPGGEKVEEITPHYIKTSLRTIEF